MPIFKNTKSATPIEDISDLILTHISSKQELNEWEAANILKAAQKYLGIKKNWKYDVSWMKSVHKEMFDETWKWAGKFRRQNFNIGANWPDIFEQIKILADDIVHWEKDGNKIGILDQSVRIHHRLVKIHPFVNGNGRHARLVSDVYLFNHGHKLPTWPNAKLIEETNIRNLYVKALKEADKGNYIPLINFTKKLLQRTFPT